MPLKVGDKIPFFTAIDSKGDNFEIQDYIGQPMVIYFYPKDNTPACTTQACGFRDNYQYFKDLGMEVIGISSDSVQSHNDFKNKFNLPFILLSDNDKKLRKLFGVPNDLLGLLSGRVTYFVNKEGVVEEIIRSMSGKFHVENVLKITKRT